MKKKAILLVAIMLLFVSILIPIVKATDVEDLNNGIMLINNVPDEVETISREYINKDVYDCEESLKKQNETVNGNMYLCANSIYIENEIINGDIFISANTVKIDENTIVNGNVYICALNVRVDATITRGVYVCAKDIIFDENSSIKYDANIFAEHIVVKGFFERNLNTFVDNLEIEDTTNISGDLNYVSDKEAKINDKAVIKNVNFDKQVIEKETVLEIVSEYVVNFAKYFVLVYVVFMFMMKVLPNFVQNSKKYLGISSFGLGILSIILMPIIFVIMILLKVTASLAMLGLVILITMLLLSMAITNISIASAVSNRFEKLKLPISVALTTIVSWIIYQIPFFGGIVAFFMVTTGLGIVLKYLFIRSK